MSFRENIFRVLRVDIPSDGNRFCSGRIKKPEHSPFMVHRQQPSYQGWRDRRAGCYRMKHNRLDYTSDAEAKP